MSAKWYIAVLLLLALALMGFVLSSVAAKAQETYYFPMKVLWWCHGKTDVKQVMDSPNKLVPRVLMYLIITGKCGHGAFSTYYSFLPDTPMEKQTTSDGAKYILIGGRIFSGGKTFRVFVAATPGAVRSYTPDSDHSPPVKPGQSI